MNAPVPTPSTWTTGDTSAIRTGTWRSVLPRHIHAPSPCHAACPVQGDIADWIGQAHARDFRGAWETLVRHNPFPAIAGRVCHHPCESACNRAGHDESLAICKLERFVGDMALAQGWPLPRAETERLQSVAVVGAGPSGLSAAYQLRRLGYRVSLLEAQAGLGGIMRYGIPAYRLARDVLDGEIDRIIDMGIDLHLGVSLTDADGLALLRAGHGAVYLATGARRPRRLAQLDYRQPWVIDGAEYLARCAGGDAPQLGRRVLVVGGGSAAIDAARTARRAGHEVTLLTLEPEGSLPAQRAEVIEARDEGIQLIDSSMLRAAARHPGGGLHLEVQRVRLDAGMPPGPAAMTPIDGSDFALEADAVITSIGQDPDLAPFGDALTHDRGLLTTDASCAASVDGVWAGGDLTSLARFVTEAVAMGERAARSIHRRLQSIEDDATPVEALVGLSSIGLHYHPSQARADERTLDAVSRVASQAEVQLGLDFDAALAEAARCFSCGRCTRCDNCVNYCPDLAVQRAGDGYVVLTDYCKGCGVCVKECPTGSMTMLEELR